MLGQIVIVSARLCTPNLRYTLRRIFAVSARRGEHDDRKGHHYYIRMRQPVKPSYSSDDPCGYHALQQSHAPLARVSRLLCLLKLISKLYIVVHPTVASCSKALLVMCRAADSCPAHNKKAVPAAHGERSTI